LRGVDADIAIKKKAADDAVLITAWDAYYCVDTVF